MYQNRKLDVPKPHKTHLKLPPPRPGKLNVPTPKCQRSKPQQTWQPTTTDIQLTHDEVEKYCKWVAADTIRGGAAIKEASLLVQHTDGTPLHTANAAAGYTLRAIPDLVTYYHAAAGYPVKATWIRAIKRGHYIGWPGLTAERVLKHLRPKMETTMGHMHKVKQGVQTTQTRHQDTSEPPKQEVQHDLRIHAI